MRAWWTWFQDSSRRFLPLGGGQQWVGRQRIGKTLRLIWITMYEHGLKEGMIWINIWVNMWINIWIHLWIQIYGLIWVPWICWVDDSFFCSHQIHNSRMNMYLSCIENVGRVPFNSKLLVQFGKQKMDMETFNWLVVWLPFFIFPLILGC